MQVSVEVLLVAIVIALAVGFAIGFIVCAMTDDPSDRRYHYRG